MSDPAVAPAPASSSNDVSMKIVMAGGVAIAVGSFLSWAKISAGGVSLSVSGMDGGDGTFTLIGGVLLILLAFRQMRSGKASSKALLVVTLLLAALTIFEFIDVGSVDAGEAKVSYGIGLYLIAAGVVIAVVGIVQARKA